MAVYVGVTVQCTSQSDVFQTSHYLSLLPEQIAIFKYLNANVCINDDFGYFGLTHYYCRNLTGNNFNALIDEGIKIKAKI